ncbi:pectin lyase-like superfamily protein [Striga asiatica]|uniref:Pectin lyase-like superfamily protein n=1 Tax=Striga asiatica TaxID=4170 RepID=A0A5A7P4K0_STRAF|nr:pectin lyase-like superfamily protein [Striga asiatica]
MNNVNNARVEGVNLIDSMGFHMHITESSRVTIDGIKIRAPGNSPNTDGIHISKSDAVTVSKSVIQTGDDCISIGQGLTDLTVNGVTCGPRHGIRIFLFF